MVMSQLNTNTWGGNNNCNQHARRGGRDHRGFGGKGCGSPGDYRNNTIAKLLAEGKINDICLNKLVITEYSH